MESKEYASSMIKQFMHCASCMQELPEDSSPQEYVWIEVGINYDDMIQDFIDNAVIPDIEVLIVDEAQDSNVPQLKALEKTTIRQLKVVKKLSGRKKRKGTRAPSGFVKPSPISDELAVLLKNLMEQQKNPRKS